jgi:hypothetical protein
MRRSWRRALAAALALTTAVGGVLVAGTAQAQAGTTGTLTISGDSNDWITLGKSYSYSSSKGALLDAVSQDGSKVQILVSTPHSGQWHLDFDAPDQNMLVPGTYPVRQYPNNSPTSPNLYVWRGLGCSTGVNGSFTVKKAIFRRQPYGQFYVQAFDATFVQHCDGVTAAARGEIRVSNPPPSPPPPPPPSPTMANPSAPASPYPLPTFGPPTPAGGDADLARGGGTPTTAVWTQADRGWFVLIGLGILAVIILAVNVVLAARLRRMRQAPRLPELRLAGWATTSSAVMGPWPTDDPRPQWTERRVPVGHRWPQHDPSPPVAPTPMPGKVIAVSVVVAARGVLGLLATSVLIGALRLRTGQEFSPPSWVANVLWGQLGICAGQVVFGLLLLRGKPWPRRLGLSVLWFDIAGGVLIAIASKFSCEGLVGIAVDAVLIWMLCWPEVTDWCY